MMSHHGGGGVRAGRLFSILLWIVIHGMGWRLKAARVRSNRAILAYCCSGFFEAMTFLRHTVPHSTAFPPICRLSALAPSASAGDRDVASATGALPPPEPLARLLARGAAGAPQRARYDPPRDDALPRGRPLPHRPRARPDRLGGGDLPREDGGRVRLPGGAADDGALFPRPTARCLIGVSH